MKSPKISETTFLVPFTLCIKCSQFNSQMYENWLLRINEKVINTKQARVFQFLIQLFTIMSLIPALSCVLNTSEFSSNVCECPRP